MTDTTRQNVAETMRDTLIGLDHHDPIAAPAADRVFTGAALITLPKGRTLEDLTYEARESAQFLKPARRVGTATLRDLQSLIDWSNRFKGDTSALFAMNDRAQPSLTIVADYHAHGAATVDDPNGDPTARHGHHRATYAFPLSDEWKAWNRISGVPQDKDEMGEFIEANAKDVQDPTPAIMARGSSDGDAAPWEQRMIDVAAQLGGRFGQLQQLITLSRKFQVFESSSLEIASNRDTGEQAIQFVDEHRNKDGSPIDIPTLFIITIPVFAGGAPYRLPVRFRYRKAGPAIKFTMTLYNADKAFDAAFDEALQTAREQTGLPLFMGAPETSAS